VILVNFERSRALDVAAAFLTGRLSLAAFRMELGAIAMESDDALVDELTAVVAEHPFDAADDSPLREAVRLILAMDTPADAHEQGRVMVVPGALWVGRGEFHGEVTYTHREGALSGAGMQLITRARSSPRSRENKMTEHLPECPCLCTDEASCLCYTADCICDELRACEDRVLNAAREAVAIAPMGSGAYNTKAADIAAIDAIKGDSA
jgi:hypothetical protein